MNPEPIDQSLFTFMALQLARIHANLYPAYTNPMHVSGPRKPDMQDQERAMILRKGS